jgi:hypothetical protein
MAQVLGLGFAGGGERGVGGAAADDAGGVEVVVAFGVSDKVDGEHWLRGIVAEKAVGRNGGSVTKHDDGRVTQSHTEAAQSHTETVEKERLD